MLIIKFITYQFGLLKIGNHVVSAVEISESRKEMFQRNMGERKRIWSMNFSRELKELAGEDERLA